VQASSATSPFTVTLKAGETEETFTLSGGVTSLISIINVTPGGNFFSAPLYSTASFQAKVVDGSGNPVNGATVTWSVETAQNNSPAMMSGWGSRKTGLTWGATPEAGLTYVELQQERISGTTSATNASGEASMQLTDIVGERVITVKAEVLIGGTTYSVTQAVSFGNGPLSVFNAPMGTSSPYLDWDESYQACNGTAYPYGPDHSTGWTSEAYVGGGKMPTRAEMQAVSPYYTGGTTYNPNTAAQGAGVAAGWPGYVYWSGEAYGADDAFYVGLDDGRGDWYFVSGHSPVACRR
jgi:hypothetical protein